VTPNAYQGNAFKNIARSLTLKISVAQKILMLSAEDAQTWNALKEGNASSLLAYTKGSIIVRFATLKTDSVAIARQIEGERGGISLLTSFVRG
jgi:hypothetical protein